MKTTGQQALLFLAVIVLVVLLGHYLGRVTDLLWACYAFVHGLLSKLFSSKGIGHIISGILSLGLVPLCLSAVPAAGYWLLTKQRFPYFWPLAWAFLIVLATVFIIKT